MTEVWKPIDGYEDCYQVSSHGRVMRTKDEANTWAGRVLKGSLWGKYPSVVLCSGGIEDRRHIHCIVAHHFIGPKPNDKNEVNHIDGNKLNNRAENLEYVTWSEQRKHAVDMGLVKAKGELNPRAKLTKAQAIEIRNSVGKIRDVAAQYGITHRVVSLIRRRLLWKDAA